MVIVMEELYGFHQMGEGKGLPQTTRCYQYKKVPFIAAETEAGKVKEEDVEQWMKKNPFYKFLLVIWKEQDEERTLFFSRTRQVRALEFLDFLIPEFGLVRGDAEHANGRVSAAILGVQMASAEVTDTLEYFMKQAVDYFEDCDWIDALRYGMQEEEEITQLPIYTKKRVAWAYVRSTDIVRAGRQFHMKSLENESGLTITAADDIYIMIGCRGEIYDIKQERFKETYEMTNERLEVFKQMLDFIPEVQTVPEGEYISLDLIAHMCYPVPGAGIRVRQLEKRTKVFPADGSQEYFLGRPGDYLAIRQDDFTDIYIIQENIFTQTYEKKE